MAGISFNSDFREFLQLLAAHEVRYLIVGDYAVGIHGHVRATGDLDVFVDAAADNAARLVQALNAFGFEGPQISLDTFTNPSLVFSMGVEPLRLQLMTTISGLSFSECYLEKQVSLIDGLAVNHINRKHLLKNKAASARPQNLADIAALKRKA